MIIRSEDTRTSTWVFVEHLRPRRGLPLVDAQKMISEKLPMPNEYTLAWSGQHEIIQQNSTRWKVAGLIALVTIILCDHHPIALRRFEELAPYPHRAADGAIQCGRGNMVPMTTGLQLVRGGDRRGVQGHRADEHRPGLAVVVARPATQNGEGSMSSPTSICGRVT